jgi:hypothetical protein
VEVIAMATKQCKTCGLTLPVDKFYENRQKKLYYSSDCKVCTIAKKTLKRLQAKESLSDKERLKLKELPKYLQVKDELEELLSMIDILDSTGTTVLYELFPEGAFSGLWPNKEQELKMKYPDRLDDIQRIADAVF